MPILDWLPRYVFKENLLPDIIGGLTTGIMHVPQGIAYSTLAGVDPVYGLYASCFPAFFYMFFGTSRHASIGSFAVVALMAGVANDNVMLIHGGGTVELIRNNTQFEVVAHPELTPIQVATTLTFAIGIWQILCGFLRLQFLMTYFSDPLISGFTTGAAVHVLVAQIDDIMGVRVPKASGAGYVFIRLYDLAIRVPQVNLAALIISLVSMTFLWPVTTTLSSTLHWHENNSVAIVGDIPAGLPQPELPTMWILKECMMQSIGISIVIIAVHISMAKMLAKKLDYSIDDSQELYAIGLTSLLGSFFSIYPVSTALGRTMVNVKSGARTQLSALFSCSLLLAIILWFGPLLRNLPSCVLASIITVALKSMFMKYSELKSIYPVSKIDFSIWVVSFTCTVFVNVMEGLAISLIFALFTVIGRSQWPEWEYLFPLTEKRRVSDSDSGTGHSNVCVFRFDGPLLFTNVERFKTSLKFTIDNWTKSLDAQDSKEDKEAETPTRSKLFWNKEQSHFLIIDCTAIADCDYMAVCALTEIAKEFVNKGGTLYLAGANGALRSALEAIGFFEVVERECLFPTLKDAITIANRNGSALRLLCDAKKEQLNLINSLPASITVGISSTSLPTTPSSSIVRLSSPIN
ncbi:hypothetical protein KIN20_002463 [Parelaphostrongylus tenuis]|uniref:STAS domain-containing protein n=1 Tax=Parelaphostrongylus tenuis TaxID=148309 RepID=A0AAD5QHS9_PARTN|nr:hypothetical protein KIN20_002463 [Parelaphostrongylus tenuis]